LKWELKTSKAFKQPVIIFVSFICIVAKFCYLKWTYDYKDSPDKTGIDGIKAPVGIQR